MEINWQPIETAPTDGTRILVCSNGILQEGVHRLQDLRSVWVGEVFWEDDWYGDPPGGWMIANCDEEYGAFVNATHWMSLPEPPK